jgi:hypothetical protein
MRRISIYNLLVVAVVITTFASCKKSFLELKPPTSLTPESALSTEAGMQVAVRGMYAGLRNVDVFGRTLPIIGDVMADNAYQSAQNTNRYTFFNNVNGLTVLDGNVRDIWTNIYAVILRANNIINADIPSTPNVNQYKGEAYAVRALCYFYLVRYYARPYSDNPAGPGVPIITTYQADLKPARNTVAEVYDLMIKDLDQAYSLMTLFVNSSQFSKYAAKGLQAKIYLNKNDKAAAKAAAQDVIANSTFTVVPAATYVAYWASPAIRTDKVETLFEVSSDAVGNLQFDALSYIYSQNGNYGDFLLSDATYALYAAGDVRKNLYKTGFRPAGVPVVFVEKYPSILDDRSDTKVLRLSEMYLIAAEASLPASEADALTYVNYITARRGAAPIASSGNQLFEDIITERRKELALEGDRYNDLQRLKRDIVRTTPNYPAAALSIPYSDYKRVLPIPQTEMDANPEIRPQQNTGW